MSSSAAAPDMSEDYTSSSEEESEPAAPSASVAHAQPGPRKRARWEHRASLSSASSERPMTALRAIIKKEEPSSSFKGDAAALPDHLAHDDGSSPVAGGSHAAPTQRELEMEKLLRSYKARLRASEEKFLKVDAANTQLRQDLHEMVECPVCFNVPRVPPVACCRNGHLICERCRPKMELCPSCRVPLTSHNVSLVAAAILDKIDHPCDFRDEGCPQKLSAAAIDAHEKRCLYRLVRCPHWACDERITALNLTHHVVASECGDNYRMKLMPYKEEMEYTRALDDEEGNGFWRPSLLAFDNITFYLQVEKLGTTKNWYFYVQMEGGAEDCEKYGVTIKVSKSLDHNRHSTVYNGAVCPIDIKGAVEVEAHGCGLNIRDAQMEKIFVKQTASAADNDGNGDDADGEERFKFWIEVDIYKMEDEDE